MTKKFIVKALTEIPKNSRYKYEIDKDSGWLSLDRVLNQAIPANYGFVPGTLEDDGDPLDVFIISRDPVPPLTLVDVEIVKILKCKDQGIQDDKLIGYLVGNDIAEGRQLDTTYDEIYRYLKTYKEGFVVEKVGSIKEAIEVYVKSKKPEFV